MIASLVWAIYIGKPMETGLFYILGSIHLVLYTQRNTHTRYLRCGDLHTRVSLQYKYDTLHTGLNTWVSRQAYIVKWFHLYLRHGVTIYYHAGTIRLRMVRPIKWRLQFLLKQKYLKTTNKFLSDDPRPYGRSNDVIFFFLVKITKFNESDIIGKEIQFGIEWYMCHHAWYETTYIPL